MGERQNREIPESEEEQEDPPREIADVPAVAGDTTIADAFERVVRSGRSVVLVHTDDERHLYAAESLHAAMQSRGDIPINELTRRSEVPDLLAKEVELLAFDSGRARVRAFSKSMFDAMNLSVGIHTCSGTPKHSYFDWQLAQLNKDKNGNYLCNFDGTLVA
jgi:hypothetical protein